ncbi:serpin-ZX-like [Lotus japonicus]|uniref:serpin-ZX-like n=1 Tax=Lotus japonicus TaxID=34305 RepID=UPI0025862330|nr:serpin-ZX-like [Lotus japonicus]
MGRIVRAKRDLRKSIRCQTDVALSITEHLFSKEEYQEKNLIFSPFSLHAVLCVMAAGSEGPTLDELLSFLRTDSIDHLNTLFSQLVSVLLSDAAAPSHRLSFVNGMWADKSVSLSHSFKQLVATHYKATLASVDFLAKFDQVRHEVNSWVERETNGLITKLLPPKAVGKLTRLFFANALYLKGAWKHKLDARGYYDFHLLNGTLVQVPFLRSEKEQFISVFDGFKVLRLSYQQGLDKKRRFSMYIFLPDAKDGLSALIKKLASESNFLKGKLPRQKVQVFNFRIPKFKISFTLEASNMLKELGVVSPFSERDADFTKMVDSPLDGEYVESMFHKAFIEVNEEGTEATTTSSMKKAPKGKMCCTRRPGIDFVADHPFLFLIREDLTGTILFIGQVLHPLKEEDESSDFEAEVNWKEEDEGPAKRKRSSKEDSDADDFIIGKRNRDGSLIRW